MIRIEEKQNCCGCGACAQICPGHCISMEADSEGFLYPQIQQERCIDCGLCETVCPVLKAEVDSGKIPEAYAAYNRDETVRQNSSSGGVFSLVAEKVLADGGAVYGAAWEGRAVRHIRISSREELHLLRGSKYVQSQIGDTYVQTRKDLKAGILVLYTGTPCQIEGLLRFLGKSPENLICMDVICHGVPSPMVWETYCDFREKKAGAEITSVSFREKRYGWKQYSVKMAFGNGKQYHCKHREDPYMRTFLHDFSLRPSCYQCRFRKYDHCSDLTVADFWGSQQVCPELDDDKGMSLVLANSGKGRQILEQLNEGMCLCPVDFDSAVRSNPAIKKSPEKPENRDRFLQEIQEGMFAEVAARYVGRKHAYLHRMIRKLLSHS